MWHTICCLLVILPIAVLLKLFALRLQMFCILPLSQSVIHPSIHPSMQSFILHKGRWAKNDHLTSYVTGTPLSSPCFFFEQCMWHQETAHSLSTLAHVSHLGRDKLTVRKIKSGAVKPFFSAFLNQSPSPDVRMKLTGQNHFAEVSPHNNSSHSATKQYHAVFYTKDSTVHQCAARACYQ